MIVFRKCLRVFGAVVTVCGVFVLTYNLFNPMVWLYERSFTTNPADTRLGLALGAALIAAGIFCYRGGRSN